MSAGRYLVTGAAGFLGIYFMEVLAEAGAEITTVGRRGVLGYEQVVCDLGRDTPELSGAPFDGVMHVAGKAHFVPKTDGEAVEFTAVNDEGTGRLLAALDAMAEPPKRFVHVSTVAVYGRDAGEDLDEDTPLAPVTPYGRSKAAAEERVLAWGDARGVPVMVLRLPLVVGRAAPGNLGAMADAMRRGRYAGIGSGAARRSMVWAGDVARVALAGGAGIYHLTDGVHPSFREVETVLARAVGVKEPRRLPSFIAWAGAVAGSVAGKALGRRIPLNLDVYGKMTRSLTFSDDRARAELDWKPTAVMGKLAEVVG